MISLSNVFLTAYNGKIIGPIAKLLGWILNALYNFLSLFGIENVGLSIILFTFIVNGFMIPLTIKQQKFAKMSSRMNPEILALQEKYKGKTDQDSVRKMQMEQQAIYTRYGVSPASGCLPLFIMMPIFFALYRVIYNIPAYVNEIYDIYLPLAEALKNTSGAGDILASYVAGSDAAKAALEANNSHLTVTIMNMKGWPKDIVTAFSSDSNSINYIIDLLSQFKTTTWQQLINDFPELTSSIKTTMESAKSVNSFLGMNVINSPTLHNYTIAIPILAVVTQLISNKLITSTNPQPDSDKTDENPMMQSMKVMNNVMPFFSGAICLTVPIGVGLYWVSNSLFRIIQTLFINAYMNRLDIDEIMKKNTEKMKKRYEKMGIDPNTIVDISKQKTSNINKNTNKTTSSGKNVSANKNNVAKNANAGKNKKPAPVNKNTNNKYKEGSIASYAHMLGRADEDN